MRTLLRALLAATVASLIVAGTETVASYPRPSDASGAFFFQASVSYLPLLLLVAWVFSILLGARGLDLWFPILAGTLRAMGGVAAERAESRWMLLLLAIGGTLLVFGLRWLADLAKGSPPFLFGLTVGMVMPILTARVVSGAFASRFENQGRAVALGAVVGMVGFVILRGFVSRWPKVAPVFLLGPIVSLGLWSRQGAPEADAALKTEATSLAGKPDIVLIVLDTVRAQALASYGHSRSTMPKLEAFAQTATTFQRAWTNGSWTLPGHASLFSGLRLTRHRYDSGFGVAERASPERFLASRLRSAGYATGAVAANFGVFGREEPLLFGFDHVDSEPLRPFAFHPWLFDLLSWYPRSHWMRSPAARFSSPSMRAPWAVDHALKFWTRSEGKPRFLFVNLMEAHLPWIPEGEDLGRFGPLGLDVESEQVAVLGRYRTGGRPTGAETETLRTRYDEALYSLDRSLALLLEGITKGERGEAAIVVVTSDHGESLGEHDRFGHRNSLDEEATRIPLFVRGPGLAAGQKVQAPVQLTDVFGYLVRSAGMSLEDGLDAQPLGERRLVVIEHRPGPQGALPASYPRGDVSALIDWPFKYVEGSTVAPALFDLSSDSSESRNLAADDPSRADVMRKTLREISGRSSSVAVPKDPANEERLRALGYVR